VIKSESDHSVSYCQSTIVGIYFVLYVVDVVIIGSDPSWHCSDKSTYLSPFSDKRSWQTIVFVGG